MKRKDNQSPPTLAEVARMSPSDQAYWKKRGVELGPVVEGRIIFNPGPNFARTPKKKQNVQKVKRLDPEQAIAFRAVRSFRQAQAKWTKMNRFYPATLEDHIALEHLLAKEKGIVNAFFIEGALIIGADPTRRSVRDNGQFLAYFTMDFHYRFQIISDFIRIPKTIQDGEKLLESLESFFCIG